jgi:hypothetical protein
VAAIAASPLSPAVSQAATAFAVALVDRRQAGAAALYDAALRDLTRQLAVAVRGAVEAQQLAALHALKGLARSSASVGLPPPPPTVSDRLVRALLPVCVLESASGARRVYASHVSPAVTAAAADAIAAVGEAGLAASLADSAQQVLADCPPPHPDAPAGLFILAALCRVPHSDDTVARVALECCERVLSEHAARHSAARRTLELNAHAAAAAGAVDCFAACAQAHPYFVERRLYSALWPLLQTLGCAGCLQAQRDATVAAAERVAASLHFSSLGTYFGRTASTNAALICSCIVLLHRGND